MLLVLLPVALFGLIGIVGILAGAIALSGNARAAYRERASAPVVSLFAVALLVGSLLAVAARYLSEARVLSYWLTDHQGSALGDVGIPVVACLDHRTAWGTPDLVAVIANAIFWLLLPQLALLMARSMRPPEAIEETRVNSPSAGA